VAEDIPCLRDSIIRRPEGGGLRSCVLSEDALIQGIMFKAGSVVGFDEAGRLWRCNLSADTCINCIPCAAKSEIEFSSEGKLLVCTVAGEIKVQGIPVMPGTLLLFHENGTLFKCDIQKGMSINGFPVEEATDICFFDDRRPSAFVLAEDVVIAGVPCAGRSRVWLHKNGAVRACTSASDFDGNGLSRKKGELLVFDEEGNPVGYGLGYG